MTNMQSEVYEAFRAIGAPEAQAVKAAEALARRDSDVGELQRETGGVRRDVADLKMDVATVRADVGDLKRDSAVMKWMAGAQMALTIAVLVKLFLP